MDCTQVLLSESFTEEINSTYIKLPVATLEIDGEYFTIYNSENVIGRDDSCSVTINNSAVSSKHAVIDAEDPRAHVVFDVGSTNKTKLGKLTLKPNVRYVIKDGDTVTFGNVTASYNISRQYPSSPEKGSSQSTSETNKDKVETENCKTNLLESLNDIAVEDSVLDSSVNDLFDSEGNCDSSIAQPEVVNDIYEMDTVEFDSNEIPNKLKSDKDISIPSVCLPSTSGTVKHSKHKEENVFVCDSQSDSENIYDASGQNFEGIENTHKLDCDSSITVETDKEQVEVSSSSCELSKQDADCGEQDTSVYDLQTQNPFVEESQISKDDTLFTKDRNKSNFEWEEFPEIGSPDGFDNMSNPDNLDYSGPSKVDHNSTNNKVNNENTVESSDKLDKNTDNSEVALDDDFLYPASQNVDMFETSTDSKKNLNSYEETTTTNICETSDVSINELSVLQNFENDSKLNEQEISNDEPCTSLVEKMMNDTANTLLDSALTENVYKLVTQPVLLDDHITNNVLKTTTSKNNTEKTGVSTTVTFQEEISKNDNIPAVVNSSEAHFFELDTQSVPDNSKYLTETACTSDKISKSDIDTNKCTEDKHENANDNKISEVINSSFVSNEFYELATQAVAEDDHLAVTTSNEGPPFGNDVSKKQTIRNEPSVCPGSSTQDNFYDLATQKVLEDDSHITEPTSTSGTSTEGVKDILVSDHKDKQKQNNGMDDTVSSDFYELCTEKVPDDNIAEATSTMEILTEDTKVVISDSDDEENEDDKTGEIHLSNSLTQNFCEMATQPAPEDNGNRFAEASSSEDICIENNKVSGCDRKDMPEESGTITSGNFFQLASQPVQDEACNTSSASYPLKEDPHKNTLKEDYVFNDVSSNSVSVSDRKEEMPEESVAIASDSFFELATQPVQDGTFNTSSASYPLKEDPHKNTLKEDYVCNDVSSNSVSVSDRKEMPEESVAIPSDSFFELATQPVQDEACNTSSEPCPLNEEPHKNTPTEDYVSNDVSSNSVSVSDRKEMPEESVAIASDNFFELATQPVQDEACNTLSASYPLKEDPHKNTPTEIYVFNDISSNSVSVANEAIQSFTPNKENFDIVLDNSLVTCIESSIDNNKDEATCSSNINNNDSEDKDKISYEAAISVAETQHNSESDNENVNEISSSQGVKPMVSLDIENNTSQNTELENDIVSSNGLGKTTKSSSEVNESLCNVPISNSLTAEVNITNKILGTVGLVDVADDNREVTMELSESICTVREKKVDSCLTDKQTVESSNDTMLDNSSMSITCIMTSNTSVELLQENKTANINLPLTVDNKQLPKKIKVQQSSVEDLLKILQGDDEERGIAEELTNENNGTLLTSVGKARSKCKKVTKEMSKKPSVSKIKSKIVPIESAIKKYPPVLRTYGGKKKFNIDDGNAEENSEDCVIKFKRKGCNVFPPDSEDFDSGVGASKDVSAEKSDLVNIECNSSNEVSMTNKVLSENLHTSSSVGSSKYSKENYESSEELVLKFKHKGCNVFPPDSEPFVSGVPENSDSKFDSEVRPEKISMDTNPNVKQAEGENNEVPNKKIKVLSDRDYISRGNITLHSQEVLEELEEQFRLTAVAMSPTQLSVVSDSDDGNKSDNNESPAKVRRSERKQTTMYKPLVSLSENNHHNLQNKQKKTECKNEIDQVERSLDSGSEGNSANNKPTNSCATAENSKNKNLTKSVKTFMKATPTNMNLCSSTEDNKKYPDSLSNYEQDSIDDSQNSISLDNLDSQELGRGKRKRFRTSYEGFMTDEDFKKSRKKLSVSPPNSSSQTNRVNEEIKEKHVQSSVGSSQKHVNAESSSISLQDVDKAFLQSDRKFDTPKSNTKNLKNNKISNVNVSENLNKNEKDNKTVNESNKTNNYSLCDKLDELFNIWGPADTVKLSPRAAKQTNNLTKCQNKSTSESKGQSAGNSQNDNEMVLVKKVTNNKGSRASKNKNLEPKIGNASVSNSKSNDSSSRRSATKHKLSESESSSPSVKKLSRKASESDSLNSSESMIGTQKTNRVSNPNALNSKTRSQQNSLNSNISKDNSPPNVRGNLRKRSCESDNNSEGQKKRLLNCKSEVKKATNSNQSGSEVASNSFDTDPFFMMSQEFSFNEVRSDGKPLRKENIRPPQVRRSGRSKITQNIVTKRRHEKILFTGISDRKLSAIVTKLGGEVVDSPFTCTVLVTDKVRRTAKFLSALSRGLPIVTPQWLIDSRETNSFADIENFMLKDEEAENLYSFSLKDSLKKALSCKLLAGWSVFVTTSVIPSPEEIKPLVQCSGGKCLMKAPAKWPPYSLIISCEEDEGDWPRLAKRGKTPPIVSTEALFSGILQQVLDVESYRLN